MVHIQNKKRKFSINTKSKNNFCFVFDFRDAVPCEFLSPDQTVNEEFYLSVMLRFREQFV